MLDHSGHSTLFISNRSMVVKSMNKSRVLAIIIGQVLLPYLLAF